MLKKSYTVFFLFVIVALTVYLPLRLHHSLTEQRAGSRSAILTSTFYNDAFYYLNIADNYAQTGISTYDGKYPTNGYNLLWQNILNFSFTGVSKKQTQLEYAFVLSLLLAVAAYLILFFVLFKLTRSRVLALFTVFPGFFYILFSNGLGLHYSPWAIINGMESPLSVLLFTVFLILSYRFTAGMLNPKGFYLSVSLILSLLFLARLDDIFLFAAFLFVVLAFRREKSVKAIMYIAFIPVFSLIIYLITNQITYGLALPVSGLIKSSFTLLNVGHLINAILTGRSFDFLAGEHLYARVLPLVIPLIFVPLLAGILEKNYQKENNERFVFILKVLKFYVIFKSVYILFFVEFWHQGFWYFYNQVIVFNLIIALFVVNYLPKMFKSKTAYALMLFVIIFFVHSFYLDYEKTILTSGKLDKNNIKLIGKMLNNANLKGKIIEMDDGIIAYSSDISCLSGFGLCIDREGYYAIKEGKLLDFAYKRGYRYLASVNYFRANAILPFGNVTVEQFAATPFFALTGEDNKKWNFRTVFKNTFTGLVLIRFDKK